MQYIGWLALILVAAASIIGTYKSRKSGEVSKRPGRNDITTHTTLIQLVRRDKGVSSVLKEYGLHCVGCPSMGSETIGEAAVITVLTLTSLSTPSTITLLLRRLNIVPFQNR